MEAPQNTDKLNLDLVKITPLDKVTRRGDFCCGRDNIDNFLQRTAPNQHKKYHCRVYYAIYDAKLIGFYSLAAASREPQHISAEAKEKFGRINSTPCIYLGMIGVQSDFQRHGIGKRLMVHAMETTLKVAELVGVFALILQAADKDVAEYYKKWGFEYFFGEDDQDQPRMYIPLGTMRRATSATA